MSRPRAHISWKTKYAAALLALGDVSYEHAKQMTEDQIISLYQVDHGVLHAFEGSDLFWNLTPRLIAEHRAKSGKDKGIVSKADRISEGQREFMARQSAKLTGKIPEFQRRKRTIPSRPFPKRSRKFARRKATR